MNAANKRFDRIAGGELRRLRTSAAKYLGAEGDFKTCQIAVPHGGYDYAREDHIKRYIREMMIPRIDPGCPQLILCFIAEKVLWSERAREAGR